ncbi:hypothetical protein [Aeromicrobium sp. UC242_57]|uniref:hypothetical protein n=1 Tax=Aeromicrobium sp. UC242_57 TaxID=3374624 RepID=UPI0037AAF996
MFTTKPGPSTCTPSLPADVDSSGRQAVIALYDYTANKTYRQTVNLQTGAVTSASARRLQPPPSPDEAAAAITIAIKAHKKQVFARQFEQSEGVPLVSPDQVSYVAGAWVFDGTTTTGRSCGLDRCAQPSSRHPLASTSTRRHSS